MAEDQTRPQPVADETDIPGTLTAWDDDIPAMSEVLSPLDLCSRLAPHWGVVAASVKYLRYKPGILLVAGLHIQDGSGRVRWAQALAYGTALGENVVSKLAKEAAKATARGYLGDAVLIDNVARVVLTADYADRRLPGIARVLDRHGASPEDMPMALAYKPARRWVSKMSGENPSLLKVHRTVVAADTVERHQAWANAGLRVPALRDAQANHGIVAFEYLSGATVESLSGQDGWDAAGEILADAHRVEASTVPSTVTPFDHFTSLRTSVKAVDQLAPEQTSRAADIAQTIIGAIPNDDWRLSHGDYSSDQVMKTVPGDYVVLDLDRCCLDHPMSDLGSWIAAEAVAGRVNPDASVEESAGQLLTGYLAAGGTVRESALKAFASAALLKRAVEPMRRGRPDWPAMVDELISLADRWRPDA